MYIFGAILFMVLPYMAGYSCKSIFRWKETNQIETYLIGFFFLFFLQGVVLVPSVWLGKSLSFVCNIMWILCLVLVVLFGASVMIYRAFLLFSDGIALFADTSSYGIWNGNTAWGYSAGDSTDHIADRFLIHDPSPYRKSYGSRNDHF